MASRLIRKYIAWVDEDIQTNHGARGMASLVLMVPLLPLIPIGYFVQPSGLVRDWIVGIAGIICCSLFAILTWRFIRTL